MPYIRTAGEQRWKRSVIAVVLGVILVVIPAGLWALHTYYMPLDLLFSQWTAPSAAVPDPAALEPAWTTPSQTPASPPTE